MGKYKNGSAEFAWPPPVDCLVQHQRLILGRLDMSRDPILLDHCENISSVRESAEIIKTQFVWATRHSFANRYRALTACLSPHPIHAQMPLADTPAVA